MLLPEPARARPPQVRVNGETLVGIESAAAGVDAYLGVPFALAPTGERRWRAPQDYQGDGRVRQASTFAPACMQSMRILDWYRGMAQRFGASGSVFPDLPISEDCLYLNVWAPRGRGGAKLPVMVYIHGGSNKSGWSFEPNYHGHGLAAEGVIVVSVAYRLGVFGFFSHPQLAGEAVGANFALWDLLAALRWIQRNIAAFGGDPRRVTLFGESAGAGNIGVLMLAPAARGLMRRAILQSAAGFGLPEFKSLAEEQSRGTALARSISADSPPDLAALRALGAEQLLRHAEAVFRDHYHAPVIDGVLVPEQLAARRDAARWPVRELLIGTNANEYYDAGSRSRGEQAVDAAVAAAPLLNTSAVRGELRASADVAAALDRLQTAESMLCPAQWLAARVVRAGRAVWMYQFTRVRDGPEAQQLRAYHGAELPYVFGTHDAWLPTSVVDWNLTRTMMQSWVRFARTGSPAGGPTRQWPRFPARGAPNTLRFDTEPTVVEAPEPVLCRIYRETIAP